jgi:hypothetical protein
MANEHPVYYSTGEICDQKIFLDFMEVKYTPADWSSSDLFDTLEQCCVNKFYWDKEGCMANSPQEMKLMFKVDIQNLVEPSICQDADIIANALIKVLEDEPNSILEHGLHANVTSIGGVTLSRNADTGVTECGGSLVGQDFLGGTDGRNSAGDATGVVTTINVEVSKKCYESKTEEQFANLITFINSIFVNYFNGDFTDELQSWANERVPQVTQLFDAAVLASTYDVTGEHNPYQASTLGNVFYPNWRVSPGKCVNDGMQDPWMDANPADYHFDTAADCCARHFPTDPLCEDNATS